MQAGRYVRMRCFENIRKTDVAWRGDVWAEVKMRKLETDYHLWVKKSEHSGKALNKVLTRKELWNFRKRHPKVTFAWHSQGMSEELINSSSVPCHPRVLYWHQTWVPYTLGDHSKHSKKLWSPCCKIPSADLEVQNHCAVASCLGEQMLVAYFSSRIWEWS